MYAAPLIAPNPANKPAKGSADAMEWVPNTTHGPGLRAEDAPPRRFQLSDPEYVADEGQSRLYQHGALGRRPSNHVLVGGPGTLGNARDSRTVWSAGDLEDRIMQARQGDAFYAGGAPRRDEHGLLTRAPRSRSSTLPSEHSPQDKVPAARVVGAVDVAAVSPADPRQPGDSEFVAPASWNHLRSPPLATNPPPTCVNLTRTDWPSTRIESYIGP